MPDDLYERDVLAWSELQAALLRRAARLERVNDIDWTHVVEAIEDVGLSELNAVHSDLQQILVDGQLEVTKSPHPLVQLSYGTPVTIDAGNFSDLVLIKHCVRGAATVRQDGQRVDLRQGQTAILSAGRDTELQYDQAFLQKSVRFDFGKLELTCARWLGHPLEQPLQFGLRPFSDALERAWQHTLGYAWSAEMGCLSLSGPAKASFDDYLLTLLLHQHPHTYSAELAAPAPVPIPGIVRRAESYMTENAATGLSIPDVAAALGVSVRSLQEGFRQWRNTTPNEFLRQTRLRLVHEELLRSDESTDVTSVALRHGFAHLGRFSGYYHAAFGELPRVTLRRRRIPNPSPLSGLISGMSASEAPLSSTG